MSLRGSKTTEAISQSIQKKEIAALPSVARNDKMGLRHNPQGERDMSFDNTLKKGGSAMTQEEFYLLEFTGSE